MIDLHQETDALASWLTGERLRALQRIIPRARVEEVLAQTGHDRVTGKRLPGWFMVWFLIALGLCCRDCYRQIFRWLQPFRPGTVPGRSTLCEARQRLEIAPLRVLGEQVIRLLGRPDTPGAFYCRMRTMAPDGFMLDVADTAANEQVLALAGPEAAVRRALYDVVVSCLHQLEALDAKRLRPVRRALANHRDTLPAFATRLDQELEALAHQFAVPAALGREMLALASLPSTTTAYWAKATVAEITPQESYSISTKTTR